MTHAHSRPGTMSQHFRLTPPPPPGRCRTFLRGLRAVAVLFLTAADALLTALIGMPPLTPRLRYLRRVIGDEFRAGAAGAIDAEVVEDRKDRDGRR